MQRAILSIIALIFIGCMTCSARAEPPVIRFYSEIAAPFYWLDEHGEPQGASLDLANAITDLTGITATVEHMPWARAYYEATHHPNVVLTSVLKTPERESEFQWLGLVHVARASFIRLNSQRDIQVASLDQARRYRVGTIRGYGSANYLLEQGFVENKNLYLATNTEQLWSLLYSKRIELVLSNLVTDRYELASIGLDPDKITELYNVEALNLQLQMATGRDTPQSTVDAIRAALYTLKSNGEYARIMHKWGLL